MEVVHVVLRLAAPTVFNVKRIDVLHMEEVHDVSSMDVRGVR
jgi:hypothetical protein